MCGSLNCPMQDPATGDCMAKCIDDYICEEEWHDEQEMRANSE